MVEFRIGDLRYRSSPSKREQTSRLAEAHFAAAVQCHRAGRLREAETLYRRAIVQDAGHAESFEGLGFIAGATGRFAEACTFFRKAIEIEPTAAPFHVNLGNALKELGRIDEALASYQQAIALDSDFAEAYGNLGALYFSQGRADEACRAYESAIEHRPERGSFYRMRAVVAPLPAGSPVLRRMQQLSQRIAALPQTDQMELHFALATAYGDNGEHERSFAHFLAGNRLKRKSIAYDEGKTLGALARIEKTFSREFLAARRDFGLPSQLPIFIIGMPRSGSTLIEQILASHPDVRGAGEVQILLRLVQRAASVLKTDFPEIASILTASQMSGLADQYLQTLRLEAPAASHIVDKNLENFMAAGLISLMLPAAKIIHIRRDPLATCLSCFAQLFNQDQLPYTYDLGELGRFYQAYERLMTHWRAVLPPGMMIEIQYEDLVDDFEAQARRIVEHCGLTWDERCRDFYATPRLVKTASALQVRRPIYRNSVEKWHVYAKHVAPLIAALRSDHLSAEPRP
jgi:tetratricopeptide (TPR) repeat protein